MTDNIDSQQDLGSPLDFAVDQQARVTMATVRRAVSRGDAVLAYQPVVQGDRPEHAAFHEGLIRIIDETGRIIRCATSCRWRKPRNWGDRSTACRCRWA